MGGRVKTEGAKSYALEMSVNGVTCVCSLFQVKKHLNLVKNWLKRCQKNCAAKI